jgi:Fe2+ transport system protein FeoA
MVSRLLRGKSGLTDIRVWAYFGIVKTGFIFKPKLGVAAGDVAARGRVSRLSEAAPGFRGRIGAPNGVPNPVEVPLRLREMGFVPGTIFTVLRRGPLGDPLEIELRGYRICLRRSDLAYLHVEPEL